MLGCVCFLGCGARTGLPEPQGGGGAGGEGGAPPRACAELTQRGDDVVLSGTEAVDDHSPVLMQTPAGVLLSHAVSIGDGQSVVVAERFDPWSAWPPAIALAPIGPMASGSSFAAGHGPLGTGALVTGGPDGGPVFIPDLSRQIAPQLLAFGDARPQLVRSSTSRWLVGYAIPEDNQLYLHELGPDLQGTFLLDWGCGSTPTFADAIAQEDDSFLVALSSGEDFGGCGVPGGSAATTRLQLGRFDPSLEATLLFERDLGAPLDAIRLAPRPEGPWLVTRTAGAQTATIYVLASDGVSAEQESSLPLVGSLADALKLSASPFGERLALGYTSPDDDGRERLRLVLVDPDGVPNATLDVSRDRPLNPGDVAVLGSPDGELLLAAWTAGEPEQGSDIHLALFECAAPR